MKNNFAKNIKKLRNAKSLIQAQIADDLIVNRATYASWEEGRGTPKYDQLILLADYYKITIDELVR